MKPYNRRDIVWSPCGDRTKMKKFDIVRYLQAYRRPCNLGISNLLFNSKTGCGSLVSRVSGSY